MIASAVLVGTLVSSIAHRLTSLQVAATFLAAECKTVWQLVLCQGFAIGGSAGFIFLPALSIVTTWFDKRRGQAYGVVAVGSSVGGTVLPIALRKLLVAVGFKWTVRTLAFIFLALLIVANLTVKTRTKVVKSDGKAVPFSQLMQNIPLMVRERCARF
jgi:MCP family monocarboxylic acid transporter-like MFS transporter 10